MITNYWQHMYIYPDVSIVEDVHIGNSITISTVIAKDVPEVSPQIRA